MKYKLPRYGFCSQALHSSKNIILLQNKINVLLMIFINNKVQVQNLKKKTKVIDFIISPVLRFLYLLAKLCSLYTESTNDYTECLHFKA